MYDHEILDFLKRHNYINVQPKAALIDMDGTLYDSMPNHAAAWKRLVSELGIECSREEFFMYEGRTGKSTINLLFNRAYGRDATDEEVRELYHLKTVYFQELPPVKPMPGAAEMLGFLKEIGIRRVLVTGSGQRSLIDRLEADFPGIFSPDMMITSRDVIYGKPNPEPFLKAMQKAGTMPYESIVIENAPLGVEAGNRSGAFTVGVTTGPIPHQAFVDAGAALIFPSMPDFAARLPLLIYALLTTSRNLN